MNTETAKAKDNKRKNTGYNKENTKTGNSISGHKYLAALAAMILSLMLVFTSCGGAAQTSDAQNSVTTTSAEQTAETAPSKSEMFTERDLSGEYDESEAVTITLDGSKATASDGAKGVTVDGSSISITQEGTYIFTGTLSDGQIIVDADDQAKVQIVLKDASITSKNSAALYVKSADKVFVTTAEGTDNTLANGGSFTAGTDSSDSSNIDGAVFAKDDVTFNGKGTLSVTSPAGHGIVGKDDVKIAGGTVTIEAANHGIQANDSVRLAEANVTITAGQDSGKDGIHVNDGAAEDGGTSESFFYMADGSLTIGAGDDGIHAESSILIEGGDIEVGKSYEGLEALTITIAGGNIDVTASDDGINAAGGSSNSSNAFGDGDWGGPNGGGFSDGGTDGSIIISGGKTHISANGDGVDSNGSVEISGGYTLVEGPTQGDTSVLDYNVAGTITGGTFIGTGGAGMASNFSSAENQGIIVVSVGNQSAGTAVTLKDADGNTIAETTPELDYAVVYISTPDMEQGGTYTLTAGSYSETIELSELIYGNIGGSMGGRGMGGGQPGQKGSEMGNDGSAQNGQNGQDGFRGGPRPDGMKGDMKGGKGGMKDGRGMGGGLKGGEEAA
ncbi:MAG: carbohydrate-binding domain-containing protein [Mogibacterium sp.]|nr:carbohydrate-binding domain-containing protein [Mogibacterium sp.]